MNLLYQVEYVRYEGKNETHTLMVTVDRMLAIGRAREHNARPHAEWEECYVLAWVDGEYNWCYVNLDDGTLYDYADHGGKYQVTGDFSFAANPPANRKDTESDDWID